MQKILPSRPVFGEREFGRLSNIFDNAGQVFLGVVVLTPLVNLDIEKFPVVLLGAVATFVCWMMSYSLSKKGEVR